VADGKPYVTEMDLRHSLIPDELIDDLLQSMPEHRGPDMEADRDVPKYDYISFMQGMINDKEERAKVNRENVRPRSVHGNGNITPKTPTTPKR
jgi:hypothetical protein